MLTISLINQDFFDAETSEFIEYPDMEIQLEHSLISMSKWESLFEKPFLAPGQRSRDEVLSYIGCMILTPGIDSSVVNRLGNNELSLIDAYISSKQSATTFGDLPARNKSSGETITSELIYYWMVAFNIPFECQTWHLNRLFSLIRILNLKQEKPKKMSRAEISARNAELNAKRRAALGTSG